MQKKIKIMHVAQSAGGVDIYIRMLLKYLDHDKFECIFVCSQDFKKQDYIGLVKEFLTVDMKRSIGVGDIKAIVEVRKLIKKYSPDIVYAHSSKAGAIARAANIGLNNICIYNPHGWAFNIRCSIIKQVLYIIIEKVAALFCEKIICISEAEKQSALKRRICRKEKIQVIYNGIDIEAYESREHNPINREDLNIPNESFVIGMVGRITSQKAPDNFIKVAKLIKKDIPNAFFLIVGTGEKEEEIKRFAQDNQLIDSIKITGWVNDPINYMELFDIAMLLSRWEGFGLVLPEYMLTQKPIIASNVDAIPNIISDHMNGLLVDVDDISGIYKAIIELYKNRNLCKKLTENGFIDVHKKFDVKRVAKEHSDLFTYIINCSETMNGQVYRAVTDNKEL